MKKGDKVVRIRSNDPAFPVGAKATVLSVNLEVNIALVMLSDKKQFTPALDNSSKE